MKKLYLGLLLGTAAGILDVIPMLIQKLSRDANISAFVFRIAAGFMISTSTLKLKGAIKGFSISLVLLAPLAIIIGWEEPISLVPIVILNVILGSALGFFINRFGKGGK